MTGLPGALVVRALEDLIRCLLVTRTVIERTFASDCHTPFAVSGYGS